MLVISRDVAETFFGICPGGGRPGHGGLALTFCVRWLGGGKPPAGRAALDAPAMAPIVLTITK